MLWLFLPNALTDREARERWRRPYTVYWLGAYASFLAICGAMLFEQNVPHQINPNGNSIGVGHDLFQQFSIIQLLLWTPLGVFLGAPSLAVERQRRSLLDFFMAGLTPAQIVAAKWRSVANFALVIMLCPLPVLAICFELGGVSPAEYGAFVVLLLSIGLSSCAIGLLLSVECRDVSAALSAATLIGACLLFVGGIVVVVMAFIPPIYCPFCALGAWLLISSCLDLTRDQLTQICLRLGDEIQTPQRFEAKITYNMATHVESATTSPVSATLFYEVSQEEYESGDCVLPTLVNGAFVLPPPTQVQIEVAGRHDIPLSVWENQLDVWTHSNPVSHRMWRAYLRTTARFEDGNTFYPAWGALPVGVALWWWGLSCPSPVVWEVASLGVAAILSGLIIAQVAPTFGREREEGTLQPLGLTALSPGEILAGKLLGATLITLRLGFWPLLSLSLWGLSCDLILWICLEWLMVGHLCLTMCVAAWASLRCRQSSVAAAVSWGFIFVFEDVCFNLSGYSNYPFLLWGALSTLCIVAAWLGALRQLRHSLTRQ